jgi:hypothetical protein
VRDCRIERNRNNGSGTASGGGGMHVNSSVAQNCLILHNYSAEEGGGVELKAADSILRNCLIAGNSAVTIGGGINAPQNTNARQKMDNCTVVGNAAGTAAGGGGYYTVVALSVNTNCIVYSNQAAGVANDLGGTQTNAAGLLTNFSFSCSASLTNSVNANITNHPGFKAFGSGYGLSHVLGDYRLTSASPCVNAGTNRAWMIGAVDLDGNARLNPTNGPVDMGAYEFYAPPAGTVIWLR